MSALDDDCEKAFEFPDWKMHLTHNNSEAVLKHQLAAQSALLRQTKEVLEYIRDKELEAHPWEQGWNAREPEVRAMEESEYYRIVYKTLKAIREAGL